MSKYVLAKSSPVRPNPVCTSSAIKTIPRLRQICANAGKKSSRWHDEASFAQHRLYHNGGDGFSRHHTAKGLIEQFVYLRRGHRSPVGEPRIGGHSVRDAIDIGQKRAETFLVGVGLAGERQAQHGAAVKAIFHRENCGAAGKGARDLYRILHCLRTAVHQESLLGKATGRELVELFRQLNIALVAGHLEAEMEKGVQLRAKRA